MHIADINWIGVIAAAFVYFIFGGLWFSKFAFGKKWDEALGFDRPENWKETTIYFVGPFAGCLVASIAMAMLAELVIISSYQEAIHLGLVAGLGFATTVSFVNAISPIMKKPILYGAITGVYHAIGAVIVSVILYAMG